ncbi:MAG TPA: hypothetical protein VGJ22_07520 [Anaerolineales bacterium]|jgi:hypothetical protein
MTATSYIPNEKPGLVMAVAVITLISGIANIFWGLCLSLIALGTLVGIVCIPFTVLPTILGIFEIIYAAKLLGNPPQPVQPANALAILEIVCILTGNVFSMIAGILSLVFYNDAVVKDFFARLNATKPASAPAPAPAAVTPAAPPSDAPRVDPQSPRKVA